MNRRNFSKALLGGSIMLPFTKYMVGEASAVATTGPSLKLAAISRTIDVNGRAATVFGLTSPDGKAV